MRYIKCSKDHYYDADQYSTCPYCGGGAAENKTVTCFENSDDTKTMPITGNMGVTPTVGQTVPISGGSAGVTLPLDGGGSAETVPLRGGKSIFDNFDDDQPTVFEGGSGNKNPVVGWLVCTTGTHIGEDFRLTAGNNTIGRSGTMDVCLSGENTVSRGKHAVVVYEPEENVFLTTPGDVKELSYLNGKVVLTPQVLKRGDRIKLGEVELMFIPCCGENFTWRK